MVIVSMVRVAAALAFLLFVPGFAWTWVIFGEETIGTLERVVHSVFLSIALLSAAYFFANLWFRIPVNLPASAAVVAAITAIPLIHLWMRRKGVYARMSRKKPRSRANEV